MPSEDFFLNSPLATDHLPLFLSPDPAVAGLGPAGTKAVTLTDPQTWNMYAYVRNNPTTLTDPSGLWPTRIHNEIIESVFGGVLSRHQVDLIMEVSAAQDGVSNGGQSTKNSNWHAQCGAGQSMTACEAGIANHVNANLALARRVSDDQGLSDEALTYFSIAGHTLTDMGSPAHAGPDGTPTTWNGIRHPIDAIGHVGQEDDEAVSWFGIGQSVRNLIAGFVEGAPEYASKLGDPSAAADRAITSIVSNFYTLRGGHDEVGESAARLCALGNRAACD